MDSQAFHLVEIELSHAGETSGLTPEMLLLEELRITPEKELPTMDFLFRLFGRPCFPRGELVAITGKAKSGKTFVTSMLMSCCARSDVLSFSRQPEPQMRVLWYDTEQSEESTQDILRHRISPMVGPENYHANLFDIFNVRSTSWKQRMGLLEQAVGHYRPDMVIVDGIRDLVDDINDGVLAQETVERLMQLASKTACCIVCVLHQNKSSEDRNLRGWIGTELTNKAFEVYVCEKDANRTFALEQTHTRKYDIVDRLYFTVGDDGLPRQVGMPIDYEKLAHKMSTDEILDLYSKALAKGAILSYKELQDRVMKLGHINHYKQYHEIMALAVNLGIILKSRDHVGRIIYTLNPERQNTPHQHEPVQSTLFPD